MIYRNQVLAECCTGCTVPAALPQERTAHLQHGSRRCSTLLCQGGHRQALQARRPRRLLAVDAIKLRKVGACLWASLLGWQASQEGVHICLPKAVCGPQAGHCGQLAVQRCLGCLRRCGWAEGLEAGRGAWGEQAGQLQGPKGVETGRG